METAPPAPPPRHKVAPERRAPANGEAPETPWIPEPTNQERVRSAGVQAAATEGAAAANEEPGAQRGVAAAANEEPGEHRGAAANEEPGERRGAAANEEPGAQRGVAAATNEEPGARSGAATAPNEDPVASNEVSTAANEEPRGCRRSMAAMVGSTVAANEEPAKGRGSGAANGGSTVTNEQATAAVLDSISANEEPGGGDRRSRVAVMASTAANEESAVANEQPGGGHRSATAAILDSTPANEQPAVATLPSSAANEQPGGHKSSMATTLTSSAANEHSTAAILPSAAANEHSVVAILASAAANEKSMAAILVSSLANEHSTAAILDSPSANKHPAGGHRSATAAILPSPSASEQSMAAILPSSAANDHSMAAILDPPSANEHPGGGGHRSATAAILPSPSANDPPAAAILDSPPPNDPPAAAILDSPPPNDPPAAAILDSSPPNDPPAAAILDSPPPNDPPAAAILDSPPPNDPPAAAILDSPPPNDPPAAAILDSPPPNDPPAAAILDSSPPNEPPPSPSSLAALGSSLGSLGPAPDSVSLQWGPWGSLDGDRSSWGSDSEVAGAAPPRADRFGFLGGAQSSGTADRPVPLDVGRQRELKWLEMLKHWDKWVLKRYQKVKLRCRKGIPSSLRARAWQLLSDSQSQLEQHPGLFEELERQPGDPRWLDAIEKDLHRQFPFHEMFAAAGGHGQQDLYRILKAYTVLRPHEGYCQAQAPVAAVLLMHMPAEQAFWCLVQICDKYLPGYYSAGLEALQLDAEVFGALLRRALPGAHRHLRRFRVEPVLFLPEWFMCVFARSLPWAAVLRVWDMFFCEGVKVMFRVGLVLLRQALGSPEKLRSCQGMYETMERLRSVPPPGMSEDALVSQVSSLPVSAALLDRVGGGQLRIWRETRGELAREAPPRLHGARPIRMQRLRGAEPAGAGPARGEGAGPPRGGGGASAAAGRGLLGRARL
ncbi:LOW QUALITY PROTEIN: TBC1 domain family member 10B-like, partial [Lathamus discolor]|uniref:LOW QUALITY PROTEIN: TBC1 domain family member 10B-like n=1 Tax=Lathamus discolor TaxID=678569 RepID=UPI0032B784B9